MRDEKLFFVGTGAFAGGVLLRTLYAISFADLSLILFLLLLAISWFAIAHSKRGITCVIILLASVCGIARASLAETTLPEEFKSFINTKVTLDGVVDADPSIRTKNQQVIVRVLYKGISAKVLVIASLYGTYTYGEYVELSGKLTKPEPFATEGGRTFDYVHYLAKSQVFSMMDYATIHETSPPSGLWSKSADSLFEIKHTFVRGLRTALPTPYPALATGLLTGDQHQIDDSIESLLSVTGLIWVVVLSGYHVTILAEGIVKATRWLPKRVSYGAAMFSIVAIVFATGASAPSLRGGLMACLMLYARATDRTYDSLRALCAATILILLWNPLLLAYDTGFQLSLIVTSAIIIGSPILEAHLLWIRSPFLRDIVAVSTIAQLAVLPLLLWQSGNIEAWAIPANMFIMPIVPFAMGASVVAGFSGLLPLPEISHIISLPAHALLYYLLAVAQIAATLPGSNIILPAFSFAFVVFAYAALVYVLYFLKKSIPLHQESVSR